ncbi:formate dehydrogenase subunit delta [Micromonospora sp. NPDC048830]|uniref:formate dehydrogenase subunit delta n=1 Tax=Micromonospora sp. NPDC048830 TaxID=3364257 RepID=UPI003718366D
MSALTTPPHVRMANDISRQFQHHPQEAAVAAVADHIRRFWAPRLRAALLVHIDQGGDGLDPLAVAAAARLAETA